MKPRLTLALLADPLLDHLIGTWVPRGAMAGKDAPHDVVAEWVPGRAR
jgi:hypothetical protein